MDVLVGVRRRNDDPHSRCPPNAFRLYELGINRITFEGEDQRRQAQSNIRNREKKSRGKGKSASKRVCTGWGFQSELVMGTQTSVWSKFFMSKGAFNWT